MTAIRDEPTDAIVELKKRFMNSSRTVLSVTIVSGDMPSERQPTLPLLEQLVPPELLNPAREAAAAGATPAERMQGSTSGTSVSDPTTGMTEPVAPTAPFGVPSTAPLPPPQPPPGTNP